MSIQVQEMLDVRRERKEPGIRRLTQPPRRGEDSPLKRLCHPPRAHPVRRCSSLFPVIRVFGTALRPGNNLLNPTLDIIPEGATLDAFHHVLFETEPAQLAVQQPGGHARAPPWSGLILAATRRTPSRATSSGAARLGLTFLFATQLIPGIMLLVPDLPAGGQAATSSAPTRAWSSPTP